MFKIVNKQILAEGIKRLDIVAANIARKVQAGQFVGVCPKEGDERIPLAVVDSDSNKGTITLIFHEVGPTTKTMGALSINDQIFSILGPLGVPATIQKKGEVVCVATGIGSAKILPICRALKSAGNKVIGVIGAKTKRGLMLEAQIRLTCDNIYITTEDGSYGKKGLATDVLQDLLSQRNVKMVYAIGASEMMEAVCSLTKKKKIKTFVQLNPIMVDCMGMCGSCRVRVGDKMVLACTDGPEFDGHQVDFNYFHVRMNALKELEQWSNQRLSSNQSEKESKTLTKFLSGILRN